MHRWAVVIGSGGVLPRRRQIFVLQPVRGGGVSEVFGVIVVEAPAPAAG